MFFISLFIQKLCQVQLPNFVSQCKVNDFTKTESIYKLINYVKRLPVLSKIFQSFLLSRFP